MKAIVKEVNSIEKLEKLIESSNKNPVLIYKHSSTCGISGDVYEDVLNVEGEVNVVIVQTARNVSDEIAARTGIRHQSPQAIILKDGKPVYHASHYDITADELSSVLALNK